MSANRYDELLREAAGAESFVRRSLAYLESDFRALALLALADWERAEIVSSELFPALGGLQRPAWGTWNGLLSALRSARREWLRSGSAAERQKVEQAAVLARALQLLDERLDAAAAESLKRLCEATRWRGGKLTAGNALSMAIGVRNLVAHDPPADEAGWGRLAGALRPLVEWQARRSFLESLGEPAEYRPPWFEREGATLWMFNGLEEDFSARYVAEGREPKYSAEGGARVIQSLQRLLGKAGRAGAGLSETALEAGPGRGQGSADGGFPRRPAGGRRRIRHGAPRAAVEHRPAGGDQNPPRRHAGGHPTALPAGSGLPLALQPSEYRRRLRLRRGDLALAEKLQPERRALVREIQQERAGQDVHRAGVDRGRDAREPLPEAAEKSGGAGAADALVFTGRERALGGARHGPDPPGHQAGQPDGERARGRSS